MTNAKMLQVFNDIVVLVDTREKKHQHIIDYLEANGIKYRNQKLESGDYSFELPNFTELNLDRTVLIERKNSWDEIIGNFTSNRDRFAREFERIPNGTDMHIVIETATWRTLNNESYRSSMGSTSLLASLLTWQKRYASPVWLTKKDETGKIMYWIIRIGLRERLISMK